jgi:predicted DNA-binding antitoxin AbrB/MazE fold protein
VSELEEIEVVYEDGVFKPLKKTKVKEGTLGKVTLIKPFGLLELARKHRKKVKKDPLQEFLEERR